MALSLMTMMMMKMLMIVTAFINCFLYACLWRFAQQFLNINSIFKVRWFLVITPLLHMRKFWLHSLWGHQVFNVCVVIRYKILLSSLLCHWSTRCPTAIRCFQGYWKYANGRNFTYHLSPFTEGKKWSTIENICVLQYIIFLWYISYLH